MKPEQWKEVERLYSSSIEMPPEERAQFLANSGANEEICREVESLLAQRESPPPSFLEQRGLDIAADIVARNSPGVLVGRVIDHYEVRALIGSGGMGDVYRAHDSKLDRDVALKVLPPHFSQEPERLRRSEREAKLLASLNNPNIGAIYDLEECDGIGCLILEFVEGQTLAQRIERNPIPIVEALEISRQIAEALEAAHEQGIVHRDLKPANVMISPAGTVKVLDFGIAKLLEAPPHAPLSRDSASTDIVLGTPSYMSPEQARGKPIDKRTDIWAFGCVLYELLTGRRAFQGETVTDTLAAIVEREPDWQALPPNTPEKIKDLVRRCLHKEARLRLRDIGDARIQISEVGSGNTMSGGKQSPRWVLPLIATSMVLGILIGTIVIRTTSPTLAVAHFKTGIQPAGQLGVNVRQWVRPVPTVMAFSPDDGTLVFSAMRERTKMLFRRKLTQSEAEPIPGTDDGAGPVFSPDGKWIAFWADSKIKKVSVEGGPVTTICPITGGGIGWGATWSGNDIFFSLPPVGGLLKVSASGGIPENVTIPNMESGEQLMLPQALPGGKALLLTSRKAFDSETASVVLYSLETGERRTLIEDAADARYVATGHLVYMSNGTLMAVPFDLRKLKVTGEHVGLVENVMQAVNMLATGQESTAGQFAISDSGTLLYMTGGTRPREESTLILLNRNGEVQEAGFPALATSGSLLQPRLSLDEGQVAAIRPTTYRHGDVWIFDLRGTGSRRLTFTQINPYAAIWSPDRKLLAYSSNESGHYNLYVVNADGNSAPERLTTDNEYQQFASSWTAAGNLIAYMQENLPKTSELWILRMSDRKRELFLKNPAPGIRLQYPEFSPDGHWIAYVSNESGQNEVYVRAYPNGSEQYPISVDRGNSPIWTKSGHEILYRKTAGDVEKFLAVTITSLSPFHAEPPKTLFEAPVTQSIAMAGVRSWDASADGQRILVTRREPSKDKPVTEFETILNWTTELQRRVQPK